MEDSRRPAKKKKRKKRIVIRLDAERAKRNLPVPEPTPETTAAVINFRKAVKRLKTERRRRKTSTMLAGMGQVDETTAMLLEAMQHLRELSDHQKALSRRNRIVMDEFNQCTELVGEVVRALAQMNLRVSTLECEMERVSSELTTTLRTNKRLKAQLERARNHR